jgi:hypothetical protein
VKLAQDLVAEKCGILQEERSLDAMMLQQYLDLYKQPMSEQSLEAIQKLTKVAVEKKKKKLKNKKLNQAEAHEQIIKKSMDKKKKKKQRVAPLEATV